MIERQNTGIAARNKILDLSVWGLQEKDDSDEGGKLGIVHSNHHISLSRLKGYKNLLSARGGSRLDQNYLGDGTASFQE